MNVSSSNHVLINAAVLIPIYRDEQNAVRIILIRRTSGGVHGGQLAFPGGKIEQSDESPLRAAIRETAEEIGLGSEQIESVKALPVTETRSTGYRVYPFLARIQPPEKWQPDPREVAEILIVGLDDFDGPYNNALPAIQPPYYLINGVRTPFWGLSFRIFHPLLEDIRNGNRLL